MSKLYPLRGYPTAAVYFLVSVFCLAISLAFAAQFQLATADSATDVSSGLRNPDAIRLSRTSPSPTPTPEIPHTLVGSYYSLENGLEAKLLLNNKGNSQLVVEPTLYNLQGQELQLPSVTVDPQSFRFVDLQDWTAVGGETFRSGNIKALPLREGPGSGGPDLSHR